MTSPDPLCRVRPPAPLADPTAPPARGGLPPEVFTRAQQVTAAEMTGRSLTEGLLVLCPGWVLVCTEQGFGSGNTLVVLRRSRPVPDVPGWAALAVRCDAATWAGWSPTERRTHLVAGLLLHGMLLAPTLLDLLDRITDHATGAWSDWIRLGGAALAADSPEGDATRTMVALGACPGFRDAQALVADGRLALLSDGRSR